MSRGAALLAPAVAFAVGATLGAAGHPYPIGLVLLLPAAAVPVAAPLAFASAGWLAADLTRSTPATAPVGAHGPRRARPRGMDKPLLVNLFIYRDGEGTATRG